MQASFSKLEYAAKKKVKRRDQFLDDIDKVMTWSALVAEIEPFYPKRGGRGRPPMGVKRMLRMYIARSASASRTKVSKTATFDSQSIRHFVGIDLTRESAPDATTLLKFRRLLERYQMTERIFAAINPVRSRTIGYCIIDEACGWAARRCRP